MDSEVEAPRAAPVRVRGLALALLGVTAALSVASMAVPALIEHPLTQDRGELRLYLDVLEEGNLPTWWSTGLLVAAALLHAGAALAARAAGVRGAWAWLVTAAVLALLSLDDHTSLHERMDRVGRTVVSFDDFPFYWLVPGAVAGLAVVAAFTLLARRLRGPARWSLVAGVLVLLGAALGGELVQGLLLAEREHGPVYVLTYHAEELLENVGVLLLAAAAVRALAVSTEDGRIGIRYRTTD